MHLLTLISTILCISTLTAFAGDSTARVQRNTEIGVRVSDYSGYGLMIARQWNDVTARLTLGAWKPLNESDAIDGATNTMNYTIGADVRLPLYAESQFQYTVGFGAMVERSLITESCGLCRATPNTQALIQTETRHTSLNVGVSNGITFIVGRVRLSAELAYRVSFRTEFVEQMYMQPEEMRTLRNSGLTYFSNGLGYGLSVGFLL